MTQRHALYFGPEQRLFGVFHPSSQPACRGSVLVCAPLLEEGTRAFWVLKELAEKLSAGGWHVLRFNFTGLGNSLGNVRDCSVEDWVGDFRTATSYLKGLSSADVPLSVFAPRFSFALAGMSGLAFDVCCGWDPLVRPADWLASLRRIRDLSYARSAGAGLGANEFAGYDLGARLVDGLRAEVNFAPNAARLVTVLGPAETNRHEHFGQTVQTTTNYTWETESAQILYLQDVVDAGVASLDATT